MVILKFKHSDEASAYHLFDGWQEMIHFLKDNYEDVRIHKNDNSLTADMVIMELDGMPLVGYVVEPIIHRNHEKQPQLR